MVVVVFFAVIYLFAYFINKDKINLAVQNNNSRSVTYEIIQDPELNKTQEGKLAINLYTVMMCSLTGEACTSNPADDYKNRQSSISGSSFGFCLV